MPMTGTERQGSLKRGDCEPMYKKVCLAGAVCAAAAVMGTVADIAAGIALGGDLSAVPLTAAEKFAELQSSPLLGLYHLDMLNLITGVLMIPAYCALYTLLRRTAVSGFAFLFFIIGTAVFISNNTALPMFELSIKYAAAGSEMQKNLFAAAGEAMIARGAHGSFGVFPGFALCSAAGVLMSAAMLKSGIFGKAAAYTGIAGGMLLLVYLIAVTFVPALKTAAMMIAAPGGLLSLAWMILFTVGLFKTGCGSQNR